MDRDELQKIFLERIPNLCLMDDEFFMVVFDNDLECTQYVLRIIMGIDNLVVKSAVVQKSESNLGGRGARFDVLAEADGVYYDIEVQRSNAGATPQRARFNASILDTNLLNKGENFDKLPETYIIFITEHDVLKGGLPIYHIEWTIKETNDSFKDGSHIIYVNGENRADTPLGRLMKDFMTRDPEQMERSILKKRVKHFKGTKKGVFKMSLAMQDIYKSAYELGREEAREEAREERNIELIRNLFDLNQSVEFIAKAVKLPVERVIEIGKAHGLI